MKSEFYLKEVKQYNFFSYNTTTHISIENTRLRVYRIQKTVLKHIENIPSGKQKNIHDYKILRLLVIVV